MFGYAGRVLRIDLTRRVTTTEPYDPEIARRFLGGRGFSAYTLYTEVPTGADPLGPDNKVIVSTGPLSGTLVPGAGKTDITTKSPETGGYASASVGGLLCAELKYAGYDAIIVEGISQSPVYLFIDDDLVELRDASHLWGKGSLTVEEQLKTELGEAFQIASVGPAAENLVSYACITHDFGRQAGRGGVGTVLGAKKLKAIAVRGSKSIPIADVETFRTLSRAMFKACMESDAAEVWQKYGTAGVVSWANEIGALPTRNFQSGFFEKCDSLSGEVMRDSIVVSDKACFACPCPCGKYSHTEKHGVFVEGPEYETTALLGANCAIADIEDVAYANYLCDELGLDTISTGNCVAFAIECFEKGIISSADTGGLELSFGDSAAIFKLIGMIAAREGIGELLASGVKHAAEVLGGRAADLAVQVKGMEMSGYESRSAPAMLLSYMTCDVGAHHNRSWAITYDLEVGRDKISADKAAKVIELQHIRPLFDVLGACRLQWVELGLSLEHYAPVLQALTGEDRSWDDLMKISERVWNLTRSYWIRETAGFGRDWDSPPPRTWKEPVATGPTKGSSVSWEDNQRLLDMYYQQRGWDENGIPTPAKLAELELTDIVG